MGNIITVHCLKHARGDNMEKQQQANVIAYEDWYFRSKLRNVQAKDIEKIKALMQSLGVGVTSVFMRDGEIYVQDQDDQCFDLAGNMNLFVEAPATLLWLRVNAFKERSVRIQARRWKNVDKDALKYIYESWKKRISSIRQRVVK